MIRSPSRPANTGSGTTTGTGSYAGDNYNIQFLSATTYQVQNLTTGVASNFTYAAGQPITLGDEKVTLNGAPNSGDSFAVNPSTNANYTVKPATGNTGTGYAGPIGYSGGAYTIKFQTPSSYQVLDAGGNPVTSGAYTAGQAITFAGVQVTLTGTPAVNDTFAVAPSSNQNLFTTVQNLITAIQSGAGSSNQSTLNNSIASGINNLDQAISSTSTVQADVGGRLNSITTQLAVQTSQQIQLQKTISGLQGLDYAAAITSLDSQNTTLSASMQAYTLTQGLTLFKYMS